LLACGHMVERALAAADLLEIESISASVIDVPTIKPLDSKTILNAALNTGAVVTCEEHSVIGGLGSAVAELLGENAPMPLERIGVRDVFGTSGEADELMEHFGLSAEAIVTAAKRASERRGRR
jgi:transketolase